MLEGRKFSRFTGVLLLAALPMLSQTGCRSQPVSRQSTEKRDTPKQEKQSAPKQEKQSAGNQEMAKQFTDKASGVAFRYPAAWKPIIKDHAYLHPELLPDQATIHGVTFHPGDSGPFAHTNLEGAQLLFTVQPNVSANACKQTAQRANPSAPAPETVSFNGTSWWHTPSRSAAMCHHMKEDLYTTAKNGACYAFDLSVTTICPGVKEGARTLTPAETASMEQKLNSIFATVKIETAAHRATH